MILEYQIVLMFPPDSCIFCKRDPLRSEEPLESDEFDVLELESERDNKLTLTDASRERTLSL